MFSKSILLAGFVAATATTATAQAINSTLPNSIPKNPECKKAPPPEFLALAQQLAQNKTNGSSGDQPDAPAKPVDVKVFLHSIASNEQGLMSDETVTAQMKALNDDYATANIRFQLESVDKTVNATWDRAEDTTGMQRQLRKGSYKDLNLYFAEMAQDKEPNTAGICNFPTNAPEGSNDFIEDGCIMSTFTLPGSTVEEANQGKTTVHEVGHWMGLIHTFQGGCEEEEGGDMISDTPAQANATTGCPASRDSCPGQEGQDPINNFMDYSSDACAREFTAQQIERMHQMFEFRESQASDDNDIPQTPNPQEPSNPQDPNPQDPTNPQDPSRQDPEDVGNPDLQDPEDLNDPNRQDPEEDFNDPNLQDPTDLDDPYRQDPNRQDRENLGLQDPDEFEDPNENPEDFQDPDFPGSLDSPTGKNETSRL